MRNSCFGTRKPSRIRELIENFSCADQTHPQNRSQASAVQCHNVAFSPMAHSVAYSRRVGLCVFDVMVRCGRGSQLCNLI